MTYEITFDRRPQFLYVTVSGTNSVHTVSSYLRDILQECIRQEVSRVLIDERLEGPRLEADDVFQVVAEGAMNAMGVFHAIAYVDEHMGGMSQFAETLAVNRGMPVKVFTGIAEAETWLLGQVEGPDEQKIFQGDDTAGNAEPSES